MGFTVKNPHSLIVLREHLVLFVQSIYSFNRNCFSHNENTLKLHIYSLNWAWNGVWPWEELICVVSCVIIFWR